MSGAASPVTGRVNESKDFPMNPTSALRAGACALAATALLASTGCNRNSTGPESTPTVSPAPATVPATPPTGGTASTTPGASFGPSAAMGAAPAASGASAPVN